MILLWSLLLLSVSRVISDVQPLFPSLDVTLPEATDGECGKQVEIFSAAVRNHSLWAMRGVDATAQGSEGALYGDTWKMGNFDECLRLRNPVPMKYCIVELKMNMILDNQSDTSEFIKITEGNSYRKRSLEKSAVCVPTACSSHYLQKTFQKQIDRFNSSFATFNISVDDKMCTESTQQPLDLSEILFWSFCAFILALCIIGTSLPRKSDGKFASALRCFSVSDNFNQFLEVDKNGDGPQELAVLHGAKVISIILVFYGHRVGIPLGMPVSNYQEPEELRKTEYSMFLPQTDLVVDTFFFVSAVLATFLMKRMMIKKAVNPLHAILTRFLRIAPTYYFIVWFQASAAARLGSGPMWNFIQNEEKRICQQYWWANILFINNYFDADKLCHVHSWYVPCDMHLYLLLLLLLFVEHRRPIAGKILFALFLLTSFLIPAAIAYQNSLNPTILFYDGFLSNPRSDEVFSTLYMKTHSRATVYLMGVMVGYFLFKTRDSKTLLSRRVSQILLATIGVLTMLITMAIGGMYYTRDEDTIFSPEISAIFASMRRPLWALGLTILLLVHVSAQQNVISRALSCQAAVALGKLTFNIYLVHYLLILYRVASSRTPGYFSCYTLMVEGAGDLATSIFYAFILYLTFELPLKKLVRNVLFVRGSRTHDAPPRQIYTAKM